MSQMGHGTKAISTENAKSSTHSIRVVKLFSTFNF